MNKSSVFWYEQKEPSVATPLAGNVEVDVVVVGGGMAGLSAAGRLIDAGKKVALVEQHFCGAGASGKTSGFITPDSEIELSALIEQHGPEKAKKIWEFVLSGVEVIRSNIEQNKISCDYEVQDSFFIGVTESGMKHVRGEHEARKELGYASTLYDKKSVSTAIGSDAYYGAVRYPNTFGMNSYLYCQAMRDALVKKGVQIFENTKVTKITGSGVEAASGSVTAKQVVVCCDRFIPDLGVLKNEIYHVQTFLGLSRPLTADERKKIFPGDSLMVWDTNMIYNYFRLTGDNRLLIGGGDLAYTFAHDVSNNTDRFKHRLTAYIKSVFPSINWELEFIWPGMLGVSKDLLPIMGEDAQFSNVWYLGAATGLPWAAALGQYAADRLLTGRNEFDAEFSWKRKFVLGPKVQALLSTPVTYALSHGITKYL